MFFLCPCNVVPKWKQNVYLKYQIYFGAEKKYIEEKNTSRILAGTKIPSEF